LRSIAAALFRPTIMLSSILSWTAGASLPNVTASSAIFAVVTAPSTIRLEVTRLEASAPLALVVTTPVAVPCAVVLAADVTPRIA
jgi:hypothetical protein